MNLIVGLGNPGAEYAGTRHNVGFSVIDLLARRHQISVTKRRFQAVLGEGQIAHRQVILARPMTYMNLSGQAVAAIARYYRMEPADVIVVLDETALATGRLRLRAKGSAGGHNGLENVLRLLGTQEVPRIRIGIGPSRPGDMINHVLSRFRTEELPVMETAYLRAAEAVETAMKDSFENAMNQFNVRDKPEAAPPEAE